MLSFTASLLEQEQVNITQMYLLEPITAATQIRANYQLLLLLKLELSTISTNRQ